MVMEIVQGKNNRRAVNVEESGGWNVTQTCDASALFMSEPVATDALPLLCKAATIKPAQKLLFL